MSAQPRQRIRINPDALRDQPSIQAGPDDDLLLAWGNLDFGRWRHHAEDLADIAAQNPDVIGACELRTHIELPGYERFSPNRLDGSPGSEAIYVRDGLDVSHEHQKLEFLDRLAQRIGFRRILDVTVHHPALGDVAVVVTHIPPRRMQRVLLAPSVARLRTRLRRLQRTGRHRWAAAADWNGYLTADPAGLHADFRATWYGPGHGPHISGIDGFAISPALQRNAIAEVHAVPHPDRTDGHPTVYLRLTAKSS